MIRWLIFVNMLVVLYGCGGGGDSGSSPQIEANPAPENEVETDDLTDHLDDPIGVDSISLTPIETSPEPAAVNKDFREIDVPQGFDFNSRYQVQISVFADVGGGRVNLYRVYQLDESGYPFPDYDSKIISAAFDQQWSGSFIAFGDTTSMLVELIKPTAPMQVERKVIKVDPIEKTLVIEFD